MGSAIRIACAARGTWVVARRFYRDAITSSGRSRHGGQFLRRQYDGFAITALRQFQSRIDATAYEQAWHYPFPESLVAPRGSRLKD